MSGIRINHADIELDSDGDLCFDFGGEAGFFYFNNDQAIQLRDYLNEKLPASAQGKKHER